MRVEAEKGKEEGKNGKGRKRWRGGVIWKGDIFSVQIILLDIVMITEKCKI